jgi:hypothetical protein
MKEREEESGTMIKFSADPIRCSSMKLLLYAGVLYLAGVAALLLLQPTLVFREDGSWKEFGVGRDPNHYTWIPLWLFAILWSMISYMIVLMFAGANMLPGIDTVSDEPLDLNSLSPRKRAKALSGLEEQPPGYYMLNVGESGGKGIPKYVYLGPAAPNLIYNQGSSSLSSLPSESIKTSE